jgi:D-arabinonate dehydratase
MSADTSIDAVETWACSVPLPKPLSFGNFTVSSREYVALRVSTRGGLVAECLGHTRRSPIDVAIADLLAPQLLGRDALDVGARLEDIRRATLALDEDGVVGRARSLVDICLWDIKAQAAGVPVWRLFGGNPRQLRVCLVEGYAIADETEGALVQRLLARVEQGYDLLKIEAAHYGRPEPVREIMAAVRAEAAPEFCCDLAWSWRDARQGIAAAKTWQGLGVAWIEDPMPRTRLDQIAFLRRHSPIPIAVGDEATRAADLERLADDGCVDIVRIDATTIGGFSVAIPLAARTVAAGFRVSHHVNPELHRHCIFADASADHIEVFPADRPFDTSHLLIEEAVYDGIRDAVVSAPESAGTGLRLNREAVERFAWRRAASRP